jgi:hypothetical protein
MLQHAVVVQARIDRSVPHLPFSSHIINNNVKIPTYRQ